MYHYCHYCHRRIRSASGAPTRSAHNGNNQSINGHTDGPLVATIPSRCPTWCRLPIHLSCLLKSQWSRKALSSRPKVTLALAARTTLSASLAGGLRIFSSLFLILRHHQHFWHFSSQKLTIPSSWLELKYLLSVGILYSRIPFELLAHYYCLHWFSSDHFVICDGSRYRPNI